LDTEIPYPRRSTTEPVKRLIASATDQGELDFVGHSERPLDPSREQTGIFLRIIPSAYSDHTPQARCANAPRQELIIQRIGGNNDL
jgi:hypothetical protein